jgi:hypothetical protein
MDIVKGLSLKFYMFQLEKKDFSELRSALLQADNAKKYTEKYVDELLNHLKVYTASRRAGYKLIPSHDLVAVYEDHYDLICKIIGSSFAEHFYEVADKYQRYRRLDVSCIHSMAQKTVKIFKKYDLKLYNSKRQQLNPHSKSRLLAYDEDLFISKY